MTMRYEIYLLKIHFVVRLCFLDGFQLENAFFGKSWRRHYLKAITFDLVWTARRISAMHQSFLFVKDFCSRLDLL